MITTSNLEKVLEHLGFVKSTDIYSKSYDNKTTINIDFKKEKIIYPAEIKKGDETTCNFSHDENFVVLECVDRLLSKGYKAKHIELEPRWRLGRESKTSGKADIVVKNQKGKTYIIIECKTAGAEFNKEWNNMQKDGGQLFSYFQQDKDAKFLCLYTSDFTGNETIFENKIIVTTDDEEILAQKSAKVEQKGYFGASKVDDLYNVWNEIYERTSYTAGIFENSINAYEAGKTTRTYDKLKEITQKDEGGKSGEDGKYHEFAKILRKHNISGKENAFDKLVNLFLCKIYDEKFNKHNLEFCYRGAMSDSFESLQDRLMLLYKEAMKEFLGENITYVSDDDIDRQFEDFESKKIKTKMLKEQMHEFLRQLKFYSHSDFSFLEVHNKDLFIKNAAVLKEVVELFQDYKLTSDKTTQILGNLFELFLQKGMKQDEGQFFTPLQICEFIMYSLPLEQMLEQNQKLKVIDYACGAGHFLNTYANVASQICPNHKSDIYGIEKEYRLSKVSKVSSAMYAHDIKFTYADALDKAKFKEKDFNLLIANPPYSVKGFLETLDKDIRKSYKLFTDNLNLETNAIECFFIERANDILKSGAKVAIILPSSILNKDNIYEKTREIILSNFDIVAINELPSGTFGATGTNTIILFLNKKITYDMSQDSQNVLNTLNNIDQELDKNAQYLQDALQDYCALQNYDIDAYTGFLNGNLSKSLENSEIFTEYKNAFKKSSEYKNLLKSKSYKESTDKAQLEKDAFIAFASILEKDKLLYFSLIHKQKTMIIQAPSENKAIKKFLGYEWSNAKGNEGLHELNDPYTTPLYERNNFENKNKIAYLIRQAFLNNEIEINDELSDFAIYAPLHSCIDFKSATFNKAINLSLATAAAINPFENSKYPLEKLETCGEFYMGGTPSRKNFDYWQNGTIKWLTIGDYKNFDLITQTQELITQSGLENSSAKIIKKGAVVVSIYATLGRVGILGNDMATNQAIVAIVTNDKCLNKFIMYIIDFGRNALISKAKTTTQQNISLDTLKNFKIPLPPLDVQKQIVAECEEIEKQYQSIRMSIDEYKELIKAVLLKSGVINENGGGYELNSSVIADKALLTLIDALPTPQDYNLTEWESVKISNKLEKLEFKSEKIAKDNFENNGKYPIISQESNELISGYTNLENPINENLPLIVFGDHTCVFKYIDFSFFRGADGTQILKFNNEFNMKFAYYVLKNLKITNQDKYERHYKYLKEMFVSRPPLDAQEKIVQAIEKCENKIKELENSTDDIKTKTKEVLHKHLF